MPRFLAMFLLTVTAITLLASFPVRAEKKDPGTCVSCHEEMYVRAVSSPVMHTMIDQCTGCHYLEASPDTSRRLASKMFRRNMIFILGDIAEEDSRHIVQIDVVDRDGNAADPVIINTASKKISELPEEQYGLNEISEIRVEKVERKMFAKAVISWRTDVPTASKVEYGTSEKERTTLTANNLYVKEHKAVLTGLLHKKTYFFTITSWDMNGKVLQSEKLSFNTAKPFDLTNKDEKPATDPELKPEIGEFVFMKAAERKDVFLSISSNEPVQFKLTMAAVEGKDEETRPCAEFGRTRNLTIEVCTGCHAHDSSHPVDIRANNLESDVPEDLPTIENGTITCVTCHFGHSGNNNYLLRTKAEKDLCAKCHLEYAETF